MLAAASAARKRHTPSCRLLGKARTILLPWSGLEPTHVTTDRATNLAHAMAHRGFGGDRSRKRRLLLVSPPSVSPGRRGLQLGPLGSPGFAGAPQSLRPSDAVVSSPLRYLWHTVRVDASRGCRRYILRDQHCPIGIWTGAG